MRRVSMLMPAILLTCALVAGCEQAPKTAQSSKTASLASRKVWICAKCGQIKGSADCCKTARTQKCSHCGLVKGSPGCCKIK